MAAPVFPSNKAPNTGREISTVESMNACQSLQDILATTKTEVHCNRQRPSNLIRLIQGEENKTALIASIGEVSTSTEISNGNIPDIIGTLEGKTNADGKPLIINQEPLQPFDVFNPFASRASKPNTQNTTPKQTF